MRVFRRPRGILPSAALVILAAAGAGPGCRGDAPPPSDPSLHMEVGVSPTPGLVGQSRVLVSLSDTAGPVEEALVEVTGIMSHAGMVPVVDTASREQPGHWAVPDFPFDMAGDWILEVRARLADGRVAAVDQPIRVVGGGGPR